MYNSNTKLFNICIDLEPGVYVFNKMSGTGKTYLAKELNILREKGEPVTSFTYADSLRRNLSDALNDMDFKQSEFKVVMLDRYDMYKGKYEDTIKNLATHCVVLIDCKHDTGIDIDEDMCFIEFSKTGIKVGE
jgi:hypothetical protein